MFQKAENQNLRLSGYPEIMASRALLRIKVHEFEEILIRLRLLLKGLKKEQEEMIKNLTELISLTEKQYRNLLMQSGDPHRFLKGIFGVKKSNNP